MAPSATLWTKPNYRANMAVALIQISHGPRLWVTHHHSPVWWVSLMLFLIVCLTAMLIKDKKKSAFALSAKLLKGQVTQLSTALPRNRWDKWDTCGSVLRLVGFYAHDAVLHLAGNVHDIIASGLLGTIAGVGHGLFEMSYCVGQCRVLLCGLSAPLDGVMNWSEEGNKPEMKKILLF